LGKFSSIAEFGLNKFFAFIPFSLILLPDRKELWERKR
jgi:hypothetical protein